MHKLCFEPGTFSTCGERSNHSATASTCREVNVSLPSKTLNNGSYHLHVYVSPAGVDVFKQKELTTQLGTPLTEYSLPKLEAINLMGNTTQVSHRATSHHVSYFIIYL